MKLIEKLKQTECFRNHTSFNFGESCSIVGNSGCLLESNYGLNIDSNVDVIRFNNGSVDGFVNKVGEKSTFRILNCHFILNIDNERYYNHQKSRFPNLDRYALYKFSGENLIFKTDPSWELWKKSNVLKEVEKNNNIYFFNKQFYNLAKKMNNNSEATNGFMGLLFALKHYDSIDCFGFSFYKKGTKEHYYDDVKCNPRNNHNFDTEEKWFNLLNKNNIISIYR